MSNPGHQRRMDKIAAIEAEFGEPIADIIQGLREENSWRTVAGCLGIGLSTLVEWRKMLGLPLDARCKRYDPSSRPELTPCDLKAIAAGYSCMRDAVIALRLQGKTMREAAEIIGCHPSSVSRYTPKELKGIYNRSPKWWETRRAQCMEMIRIRREKRAASKGCHPWNKSNESLFRRKSNGSNG